MKIEKIFPIESLKESYWNYGDPAAYIDKNHNVIKPEFALLIEDDNGRKFILQKPHIDTSHISGAVIGGKIKRETEMILYKKDRIGNEMVSGYNLIFTYDGIDLDRMLKDGLYANYVINTLLSDRHLSTNSDNKYYVESNNGLQKHIDTGIFNLGQYNESRGKMVIYSDDQIKIENTSLQKIFKEVELAKRMKDQKHNTRNQEIERRVEEFWQEFGDDPQVLKAIAESINERARNSSNLFITQ